MVDAETHSVRGKIEHTLTTRLPLSFRSRKNRKTYKTLYATWMSYTRLLSTATTRFGTRSKTNTGPRNMSSMGEDEFVFTTSARATTARLSVSCSSF